MILTWILLTFLKQLFFKKQFTGCLWKLKTFRKALYLLKLSIFIFLIIFQVQEDDQIFQSLFSDTWNKTNGHQNVVLVIIGDDIHQIFYTLQKCFWSTILDASLFFLLFNFSCFFSNQHYKWKPFKPFKDILNSAYVVFIKSETLKLQYDLCVIWKYWRQSTSLLVALIAFSYH